MALHRPVLVTGTPRCGKSLLCRILDASESLNWIREPKDLWCLSGKERDDCWLPEQVSYQDIESISRRCEYRLKASPGGRYLDDLSLHSLRIQAAIKVVPDACVVWCVRDPAQIIPELTSYWKGRNVGYAIGNRLKKGVSYRRLPLMAAKFLKNRLALRFFGRLAYVGPVLPEIKRLPLRLSAAGMASAHLDAMLTRAVAGFEALPKEQWLRVRYEDLCAVNTDDSLIHEICRHCDILNDVRVVRAAAKGIVNPSHRPRHWLAMTSEEKKIAEPVIEKWRTALGYAGKAV